MTSPSPVSTAYETALRDATALHKTGRFAEAVAGYEALIPAAANDPQLHYLLGAARLELLRFDEAIAALEHALALRPHHGPTLEMLGSVWMRAGQAQRSLPYFRDAAAASPDNIEAQTRLAMALRVVADDAGAKAVFLRILERQPAHRQALWGLGLSLARLGETNEAERILRECIAAHPDYDKAYVALATLLGQLERFVDSEACLRTLLARWPGHQGALPLLAGALYKQGRFAEAVDLYKESLRAHPENAQVAVQLGESYLELNQPEDAAQVFGDLLARVPDHSGAMTGLGRVHELRGELLEATRLHTAAIALDPTNENALLNRGSAQRFAGAFDEAIADYDAALTLRPNFAPAIANRGLALLTLGRLSEAWPLYRARIRALGGAPDLTDGKPWDGTPLHGKRVLVWLEYGLGDEIMFASLLPELLSVVAQCTIVCAPRLVSVFARSFPTARVAAMGRTIEGDFDVRLPLSDVAQWLRPTLDSFPQHGGYLKPDGAMAQTLRARYQHSPGERVVGLSWRSASGPTGRFKSADLSEWGDILRTPGLSFVSLQYGDCGDDLTRAAQTTGREIIQDPLIDSAGDLDPFVAQVAAMDLVISVSNTTVHVAGGLGRPVWTLLPAGQGAHWYWFLNRADSPWYPTARLFRQASQGDWQPTLSHVAAALRSWCAT